MRTHKALLREIAYKLYNAIGGDAPRAIMNQVIISINEELLRPPVEPDIVAWITTAGEIITVADHAIMATSFKGNDPTLQPLIIYKPVL